MPKDYRTISEVAGPLMLVRGVDGVSYNELGVIELQNGEKRRCKVLEINGTDALVQLFESSAGINLAGSKVRFLGRSMELAASEEMLGRVFDGLGNPIDGGPNILADKRIDINGVPMNPAARNYPQEFVQTGISAIDGLNTLVRGQKLPIFSASGLPHANLAAQIARQAMVRGTDEPFAVVFAAMGITFEESNFFVESFKSTGALERTVMFVNLANDPAIERIATPRMALSAAEYLAFEKNMHVLVILTDITNYADALREVSAARKEVPGRRGYPGYMYTDLASLYERAGRQKGKPGSVTMIPILTMPEDDKTHPIPDLTGYITEGQIILSRDLFRKGITPPIDVLPSLSRLKDKGIGEGKTREDHASTMNQLFSAYARGYPGYMYTDLASLYERAGRQKGKPGSVTMIPILTMPEDDKTHPIPDLTGYITEGQIILSRDLFRKGITPPIDVLPSLSRLKDKGIGEGKTREDHASTMNQLFSAYARGKEAKELMVILGEAALTDIDKLYAKFADEFEREYVSQGYTTNRSIEQTLDLGWKLLRILPKSELKRIDDDMLDKYYEMR